MAHKQNIKVANILNFRRLEFIEQWEQLHNPIFKGIEFDAFRNESGSNSFALTPKKLIETANLLETTSIKI